MQILDGFFRVTPKNIGFATCMKNIGLTALRRPIFFIHVAHPIFSGIILKPSNIVSNLVGSGGHKYYPQGLLSLNAHI